MSKRSSTPDPRRAEIALYVLGATAVALFSIAVDVRELLNGRYSTHLRYGYGAALLGLCLAGLACQLWLGKRKVFRAGSWLVLGALLFEVSLFSFLWLYVGSAPVPIVLHDPRQFQFHPAMGIIPRAGFHGVVDGVSVSHNSVRARNPGKFDPSNPSILTVGGSTTYNIAVSDDDTWTAHLAKHISPRFNVLNFGVPAHSTNEHIIFTALRASAYNPRCIIFYVGWNDIRSAHLAHLEPDYSNFHMLDLYPTMDVTREFYSWSAIGSLVRILVRRLSIIPRPERKGTIRDTSDPRLELIYRRNIRLLAVISKSIGARPIFVPQVLNYVERDREGRETDPWIPFLRWTAVPSVMRRFNQILKEEAERSGSVFIEAPIQHHWKASDFFDEGHFTEQGTRTFARLIAPEVKRTCE
jgi:lysophospholipase L1-like esterase